MLPGLTEDQSYIIDNHLSDLLVRAEAEAVFLCNKGGYILAMDMVEDYEHNDNIAALAAGTFYATREIARLIGEPGFRSVFHQGDRKSIFMQLSALDLLLVVVFSDQSNPGLVKLCADEMTGSLRESLPPAGSEQAVRDVLQNTEMSFERHTPLFSIGSGTG